jgi:hypothetical protein
VDKDHSIFQLTWTQTSGPHLSAGSPQLFGWVRGFLLPTISITDARVCILACSATSGVWVEYARPIPLDEAAALADMLARLGLPDRAPQVTGVVDTSDGWSALDVSVTVEEHSRSFAVYTESSGFAGPDADALRTMFRQVFALAGYTGYDESLYGRSTGEPRRPPSPFDQPPN